MIDIHAHILPFVDDGSDSLESSLVMLKEEIDAGVTDIILTPHYRFDYAPSKAQILESFELLRDAVKNKGLSVNLYLGQEVYEDRELKQTLSQDKVFSLNGSKYLLVEFDLYCKCNISETVYELSRLGYIPIVAHVERYFYANITTCLDVKRYGGRIQVNAGSIVGKEKRRYIKLVKQLFNYGLVDFVASDIHYCRENLMAKCYKRVNKKYGERVANIVFDQNAKEILKG